MLATDFIPLPGRSWHAQKQAPQAPVGQELEFVSAYKIDTRASVSGGFGHLFSGTFLKNTTQGVGYSYPFVMTSYDF